MLLSSIMGRNWHVPSLVENSALLCSSRKELHYRVVADMLQSVIEVPSMLTESDGAPTIAVMLPCGIDKEAVIKSMTVQILRLLEATDTLTMSER